MAPGRHFRGPAATAFKSVVLQCEAELAAFVDLLVKNDVRSYLEIGAKFGGSLWRIGTALPLGARIVAVDLPDGTDEWELSNISLRACVYQLMDYGRDAHVLWGDSTDELIVRNVRHLGPFDAMLIDGDHQLGGIMKDWENYGPQARIVAFHDIAWKNEPQDRGYRIDAPAAWDQVKANYRHVEIRLDPTGRDNGIGVLWRQHPTG
jgi:predicted O-methyltransferase YrrM